MVFMTKELVVRIIDGEVFINDQALPKNTKYGITSTEHDPKTCQLNLSIEMRSKDLIMSNFA